MTTAAQILAIAAKEIGTQEGRDKNGNWNNRVKYNTWYAQHPSIKNNVFLTTAWCAVFVSWVANQAGVLGKLIPMHAWTPSGLSWFKSRGLMTQGTGAKAGDVFYVYYSNMGRVGHVGFVERVEGDYIVTIEGNTNTTGYRQGTGVFRLRRKITSNLYFCHPKYDAAPLPPKTGASPKPAVKKSLPTVSLSAVRYSASVDPKRPNGRFTNPINVKRVEDALVAEGLLASKWADGHWGTMTKTPYSKWQQKLGYKGTRPGQDADGFPGLDSLTKLGKKHGFRVVK